MDAYEQSAQAAEEREKIKKEERALKRWVKLINGLRVRRRLQAEYGQSDNVSPLSPHPIHVFSEWRGADEGVQLNEQSHNPLAMVEEVRPKGKRSAKDVIANTTKEGLDRNAQDLSDDDTPPPEDNAQGQVKTEPEAEAEAEADEVHQEAAIAEARDKGIIDNTPEDDTKPDALAHGAAAADEISDEEMEEIIPPKRSIKLRVTGAAPTPPVSSRSSRGRKRKGSTSPQVKASSPAAGGRPKRKSRAAAPTRSAPAPAPATTTTTTRSLRSRAPKSEAQEEADREARARIRAALSVDEDEEEADLEL